MVCLLLRFYNFSQFHYVTFLNDYLRPPKFGEIFALEVVLTNAFVETIIKVSDNFVQGYLI